MAAKLENSIRTLLGTCEEIVDDQDQRWRLQKYIKSLDSMIQELDEFETVDRKHMASYYERASTLKVAINYVASEGFTKSKLKSGDANDSVMKEIKQLTSSAKNRDMRRELFDGNDSSGLRKREAGNENMEKYYENIQEKLGEEMLTLTRNLKEQTLTASKIIKKDTDIVTKSARLAHNNTGSLEKESKKLDDHNRKACKCWIWILIGLVIAIFIGMVLFMKLMKKSKY